MPGHVVSAMIVFKAAVQIFIEHIAGLREFQTIKSSVFASLSRNLASAQGRVDYIRVRLVEKKGELWAEPILGKSGLISTMVKADGLIAIDMRGGIGIAHNSPNMCIAYKTPDMSTPFASLISKPIKRLNDFVKKTFQS